MDSIIAVALIGSIFALGYWIGSMRTNIQHLRANRPVVTPKRTPRKIPS